MKRQLINDLAEDERSSQGDGSGSGSGSGPKAKRLFISAKGKSQNDEKNNRLEDEIRRKVLSELEGEHKMQIRKIRDEEHERLLFALKNQRLRLNYDKTVEIARQKENFQRILRRKISKVENESCEAEEEEEKEEEKEEEEGGGDSPLGSAASSNFDANLNPCSSSSDAQNVEKKTDRPSSQLKLLKTRYKNKMLSSCRNFVWRGKDFHLSAMTPIEEEDEEGNWLEEKKKLLEENEELKGKVRFLECRKARLETELQESRDQNELLEFRILEVEQNNLHSDQNLRKYQENSSQTEWIEDGRKEEKVSQALKNLNLMISNSGFDSDIQAEMFRAVAVLQKTLGFKECQTTDEMTEKTFNVNNECCLRNKHLTMKLNSMAIPPLISSTDSNMSDSTYDNRSQSGETGYSSDEDTNMSLSSVDVASPTPSLDGSNGSAEFEEIVQKITHLNKDSNRRNVLDFGGEDVKNRNLSNQTGRCKDFMWSLAEVAQRIKESEDVKKRLKESVRCLEEQLKTATDERDALLREKKVDETVVNDMRNAEILNKMLREKEQELKNKEEEYAIKMDAMKCDKDETVNRLESRLEVSQKVEMELREQIDTMLQEKRLLHKQIKEKEAQTEEEKMLLLNQVRNLQRTKEKLEEKVVMRINRKLSPVVEEIFGDQDESKEKQIKDVEMRDVNEDDEEDEENEEEEEGDKVTRSQLEQRLFELEKKEKAYRETLQEADKIMADVERSYQERIDEQEIVEERLRERIVQLEQSEKRLRQAMRNNKHIDHVSKFGDLLDRLLETEASEQRLKAKLHELEKQEKEAKRLIREAERDKKLMEEELQEQEEMMKIMSNMRRTEKELRRRIAELETSEGALKETLQQADTILMERERELQEKMERLEKELIETKRNLSLETNCVRRNTLADVIAENAKLQMQIENLDETNGRLRDEILKLQSEATRLNQQSLSDIEGQNIKKENDFCLKFNLQLLDRDSQIERLQDKIKVLEAGNASLELQALSVHAEELKQLKEKINSMSTYVQSCNCSDCVNCQPLLSDIEQQVGVLDEIISGGSSSQMKEEKQMNDICQGQNCILIENTLDTNNTQHLPFNNEHKSVKQNEIDTNRKNQDNCTYQNSLNECFHDKKTTEQDKSDDVISSFEKNLQTKTMMLEAAETEIKTLENRIRERERELGNRLGELTRINLEKANLQHENKSLQQKLSEIEKSENSLQEKYLKKSQANINANKQVRDLEEKVANLSREVRRLESSEQEAAKWKEKSQELESEIQKRRENERKLYAENLHLHHKVESQRGRINSMQVFKKDYQLLVNKISILERKKSVVEQSIPSLKNKVLQLTQRCKDKDVIINRLTKQLQNKMLMPSFIKGKKQNDLNKNNLQEIDILEKEKIENFDGGQSMSLSTSSDLSELSSNGCSPRQNINNNNNNPSKSKIPRFTAIPSSPSSSPLQLKHNINVDHDWDSDKVKNDRSGQSRSSRKMLKVSEDNERKSQSKSIVEKPPAPINFRVTRKVGHDSLLVAWTVPKIRDPEQNISGYLIFINDELHQKVRSPNRTKALLNRLNLNQQVVVAIQTLTDSGNASHKVFFTFNAEQWEELPSNAASKQLDDKMKNMNYKRQFVISHDFSPTKIEDVNDGSISELQVSAGDVVIVFGEKSANDYYYVEVNGRRGLLSASLIDGVPNTKSPAKGSANISLHSSD